MSRHVFVLTHEAVGLASAVDRSVGAVGLSEVGVEAVLKTAVGRVVGEKYRRVGRTRHHACASAVVSVVTVRTVYHAHRRRYVSVKGRVLRAPSHAAPGRVVSERARRTLSHAAHRGVFRK